MTDRQVSEARLGRGPKALFAAFAALTSLAIVTMYLLAGHTEDYFAWTIQPPLTAAFLGAGYGAGLAGVVVALRRRDWAYALVSFEAIFVFVVVTTAATLLHLDSFHFDRAGLPLLAAWVWLVVYLVVPVWIAIVLAKNRMPGRHHGPAVLSLPVRVLLLAAGLLLCGIGVLLFLVPAAAEALWPWALSPLTARAVAAWLLTIGVAALLVARERHKAFIEGPATGALVVAALYAAALVRFGDQVDWDRPAAWIFLVLLALLAATGAAGLRYTRT